MYLSDLFIEQGSLNIEIDLKDLCPDTIRLELSGDNTIAWNDKDKSVEVWIGYNDIDRVIHLLQTAKFIIDQGPEINEE